MSNLLQKASIVTTPTAYGVGVLNSIKPAYALGNELIPNGTFKENVNGWVVNNANASFVWQTDQTALFTSASFAYVRLNPALNLINAKYKVSFDVLSFEGTLANVHIGLGTTGNTVAAIGSYSYEYSSTGGATEFQIRPNSGGTGSIKIDNISVKLITEADFDFTRNSSATRVNPDYLIQDVSILSSNLVQNGNFSELGSELVTNGDFATDTAWTKDSDWTISGGKANYSTSSTAALIQNIILGSGVTYEVRFNVSESSGNGAYIWIGNAEGSINYLGVSYKYYQDGDYIEVFTMPSSQTTFSFYSNSTSSSYSLDNVSVKQVDPNDNWTLGTGWSFGEGKAINNGTINQSLLQTNVFTIGKSYKINFTIADVVGSLDARIWMATGGGKIEANANGNYTASWVADGTSLYITTLSTNTATYSIGNISVIEIQQTDIPRLDYTNGTASILLEPQSTNLLNYSNDFSNSDWTKQSGVTATYNTTETLSPDGTYNATKLIGNGTTGIFDSVTVSGVVSRSIYIKSVTGNVNVILKDPQNTVTQKTLNVTTQWQRFELVEDNTISSQGLWVDDIPSSGIYIYGAQIESQSYATSYIPTSGSTVTRVVESLNNAGNSDLFNDSEGVLYAEIAALSDDLTFRTITLSDGTTSNNVGFGYRNNSNVIYTFLQGVINSSSVVTVSNITDFNKVAIKYKSGNFAMWVNGVEVYTNAGTFTLNGLSEVSFDNGGGAADFYGKCKTVAVFKEALSDTELACLTSTNNREIFLNYYYRMQYVGANTEALSCAEQTFNI